MNALTYLGYIADAWILGTYALLSRRGKAIHFHWANAVGCVPLLAAEYFAGLWQVMILTGTFGFIGWVGIYTWWAEGRRQAWRAKTNLGRPYTWVPDAYDPTFWER